jgi:hypothetical protein
LDAATVDDFVDSAVAAERSMTRKWYDDLDNRFHFPLAALELCSLDLQVAY